MRTLSIQKATILAASLLMLLASARGQSTPTTGDATRAPIDYATVQVIAPDDSDATIAEKAAKVLPRPNQTVWMRLERTFFLHFGVNTFRGVEWGNGREEPSIFNPTALDANQWCSAMKEFGGKMIILVCKHHDGFCMWPTRYTPHSVVASPWRDGKGDLVREVAAAARANGLKLAVYLSPADLYQLRTNPKNPSGYYGDGSSNVPSVIPTDPAHFKTDPTVGRAPAPGFTNYTYKVDDYNRYFLNQLYELLTEYGPIGEVWFDGANPDPSVKETYNYAAWFDLIHRLQPGAIIFGKGPDGRWVGNEGGVGRTTEWSVIPLPRSPETFNWPDMTARDLGSRSKLKPGSHLWWYPAEVNTTILAKGAWFWGPGKRPKSPSQLVDVYYTSIGRNGNLILNLSPDSRGLVPDDQLAALSQMSRIVNETFATDLAVGGKLTADTANATNNASLALDGNLDTWWEAAAGKTNGTITLTLPNPVKFDVVSLQEAVDHRGQRIESFAIEIWDGSTWITAEKVASDELTTVGHRRLIRLKSPATTSQVRIHITGSRMEPTLAEIGLFKQAASSEPPTISDRDINGTVTLANDGNRTMVFTTDGSTPTTNSAVYKSPIPLPLGGTVQAACLLPNGQVGVATSKIFSGLVATGWKVVAVDSEETAEADNAASRAIDGNSATFWHTKWNDSKPLPHFITVDMGAARRIRGFSYLPRQDGMPNGIVEKYSFETSVDGATWVTNIAAGTFANIRNNPALQEVAFAPVDARFFRFTALQGINPDNWTCAAEISVLAATPDAAAPQAPAPAKSKPFSSYFLPTPLQGELKADAWGATNVLPRDIRNGLEDTTIKKYCYWDGQIIKAADGKYHMFASRWDEPRGHNGWFGSVAVHAVSDSLFGPYVDKGLCWPNEAGGRGHNVTALTMPDGRYAIIISETRPCEVYVSKSLDGPWEHLGTITVDGEPKWHASNVSIMTRPDGNFEFTQRDGRIFFSDKGILGPYQPQGPSVFPKGIPNLEDPCIWFSGGLYHIVVNSWSTRKAYHLTSRDGLHDWTNRGDAYDPREPMVRYPDGTVNHWNKAERPSVYIENGHVAAMTLAVIDVEKEQEKGNDNHGSKVIVIPFDGPALDRDLQSATGSPSP